MKRDETELGDGCPKCGALSYQGGYCFRCDTYRPSKHNSRDEALDAASFMERNFGQRLRVFSAEAELSYGFSESEGLADLYDRPIPQRIHKAPLTIAAPPLSPVAATASETSSPPEATEPATEPPRPEKSLAEKIAEANFRYTQKPEGQGPPTIASRSLHPALPQRPLWPQPQNPVEESATPVVAVSSALLQPPSSIPPHPAN